MTPENEWQTFRRSGRVVAHRLTRSETWRTSSGDEMAGLAGDWKLHEPDNPGDSWTIVDSEFRATYRSVDEPIYERTGLVEARRTMQDEVVQTEEGTVSAQSGDWVVRRGTGFQWVVPGHKFAANYEALHAGTDHCSQSRSPEELESDTQ